MLIRADTIDDLLRRALGAIIDGGSPVEASRGLNKELVAVLLKLSNPLARLSHTETKGKVFSALGELAWYLAASNDADFITYYLQVYQDETEINGTIHGAYGPRLFTSAWHNQFENVIELLRRKKTSRQAVMQLFDCSDLAGTYKDIPCTCTLQFLVREERLQMVVSMRSNDVFKGLPHDVFSFTMIQEIAARMLKIELGEYTHFASSLHLYEENADAASAFLQEGVQGTIGAAMRPMPLGDPWPEIGAFLRAEAAIRAGFSENVEEFNTLDPYWQDLVRLLKVFRCVKHNQPEAIAQIKEEMSDRFYKEYIALREAAKEGISVASRGAPSGTGIP